MRYEHLFTHDFKCEPYWWERVPRGASEHAASLPRDADVLIVGSGYTGLHAALVTARSGRDTLVLEREPAIGWGCSTRNGGQVSIGVKGSFTDLARRYGAQGARALLEEGRRALDWIGEFVAQERIDCDYRVCGRFHGAYSPRAFEALARRVAQTPPDLAMGATVVPASEQHRELATERYHGGVIYPLHASLDPARYHDGLAERAKRAGARLLPGCAVLGLERSGRALRVRTSRGTVTAREVVVATNGYTGTATPWFRRRVIPIGSYIIATEALPERLLMRLMPHARVFSDTRRVVYYYRGSPDGTRILFGGRVSAGETDPRLSAPRLHAELVRIFPELETTRITHSWMGFVAYTFDTLPHTGAHDGIHYAMGYCGSGIALASYLGMLTGARLVGTKPVADCPFESFRFITRPGYTGHPWFLRQLVAYHRWCDRSGWGRP